MYVCDMTHCDMWHLGLDDMTHLDVYNDTNNNYICTYTIKYM